jgi:hypothetical protein
MLFFLGGAEESLVAQAERQDIERKEKGRETKDIS